MVHQTYRYYYQTTCYYYYHNLTTSTSIPTTTTTTTTTSFILLPPLLPLLSPPLLLPLIVLHYYYHYYHHYYCHYYHYYRYYHYYHYHHYNYYYHYYHSDLPIVAGSYRPSFSYFARGERSLIREGQHPSKDQKTQRTQISFENEEDDGFCVFCWLRVPSITILVKVQLRSAIPSDFVVFLSANPLPQSRFGPEAPQVPF